MNRNTDRSSLHLESPALILRDHLENLQFYDFDGVPGLGDVEPATIHHKKDPRQFRQSKKMEKTTDKNLYDARKWKVTFWYSLW